MRGPPVLHQQIEGVGSVQVGLLLWSRKHRVGVVDNQRVCLQRRAEAPYHRRDVSGPQAERVPPDVLQEGGAVLGQAVDEGARQGGGHLQELVRVEERSHRGVQPGHSRTGGIRAGAQALWGPGSSLGPRLSGARPVEPRLTARPR